MIEQTNLDVVKEIAEMFLYFDLEIDEKFPFIVHHPFTNSIYTSIDDEMIKLDNPENTKKFRDHMMKVIDKIEDYQRFSYLINKPYLSAFLKHTLPYIDVHDMTIFLRHLWQNTETVSVDVNIPLKEFETLFKRADLDYLMDFKEREIYEELKSQGEIIVYRGINTVTNHPSDAMAWTLDKEMAHWFAERFASKGTTCLVLRTKVKPKQILAYFKEENEVVIARPKKIDIEIEEKFIL